MRGVARVVLGAAVFIALAGPFVAPHGPGVQFRDHLLAPPMRPHVIDDTGRWHWPFVYPLRVADRLERSYVEERSSPVSLEWFSNGRFVTAKEDSGPLLLMGSDSLGRDVFSRLVLGARLSLGISALSALATLVVGMIFGSIAGYVGGSVDEAMMRLADFVLVLPAVYVVLALRAALPLVLSSGTVFLVIISAFPLIAWPHVARGVRTIVSGETRQEYVQAARSMGAGHLRVLLRHALPAARGFLVVQAMLLVPAFILAEATLSFVGLGFSEPVASWGTMLQEASNIRAIADFPWLLSPALAMLVVLLALNLVATTPMSRLPLTSDRP